MSSRPIRIRNLHAGRATQLPTIAEWQCTVNGVTFDMLTSRRAGSEDAEVEARTSSGDRSSNGRQTGSGGRRGEGRQGCCGTWCVIM